MGTDRLSCGRAKTGNLQRLRIDTWTWTPDLRWHLDAVMPVFGLLALGSLVLGIYRGFSSAPLLVGVIAGLELVLARESTNH